MNVCVGVVTDTEDRRCDSCLFYRHKDVRSSQVMPGRFIFPKLWSVQQR